MADRDQDTKQQAAAAGGGAAPTSAGAAGAASNWAIANAAALKQFEGRHLWAAVRA